MALLALTPARAADGPGRIAVGGVFPTGYAGVLARYGLPRDMLSDDQVIDPEVVGGYDLLILGGLAGNGDATRAIRAVLDRGGSVLLDYSSPGRGAPGLFAGASSNPFSQMTGIAGASRSGWVLTGKDNPLAGYGLTDQSFAGQRIGFVPVIPQADQALVLAEYTATTNVPLNDLFRQQRDRKGPPETGPRKPALVMVPYGRGRLLLCGPPVGMATGLQGVDLDQLVMALVGYLTGGRAKAQLIPEGPHLGRKQSLRSQDAPAPTPAATAPAAEEFERPAGPGAAVEPPAGYQVLEAEAPASYNVVVQLADKPCEVLVNHWSRTDYVVIEAGPKKIQVARLERSRRRVLATVDGSFPAGTELVVKERAKRLTVMAAGQAARLDITGLHGGAVAVRGAADAFCQTVEAPYLTDDFMRTDDSTGGWETDGGRWHTAPVQNPDMGANPFSYKVETEGVATALNGFDYWDDYRFTAAVRPTAGSGTVGLGLYAGGPRSMLLFEAALLDSRTSTQPDGLRLVRLSDGRRTVLDGRLGGMVRGQWYQVMVKVEGPWVGVFVDGVKVLGAQDTTFPGGKIALRADGCQARFDDVLVEPVDSATDRGQLLLGAVPVYAGIMDVDSWAGPATYWEPEPEVAGLFWRRMCFFGFVGMRYTLPELPERAEVALIADGDGHDAASGYAVHLARDGARARVELRHGGQVLAAKDLPSADLRDLALRSKPGRVVGLVNDQPLVAADTGQVGLGRVAFRTQGFLPRISGLTLWSANLRDYAFDRAPVDWWVSSGEWDVTNRWSCTPDWSWFGGVSAERAAIWLKAPVAGDTVFDFYAGPKMMDKSFGNRERVGDFNAVLCGDGQSVDAGYSFVVAPQKGGAEIRKHGQVVARNAKLQIFQRGHNRWANVRVEQRGGRLALYLDGQRVVAYNDPSPLPGGYVGIWTEHNGIMVPRATLSFAGPGNGLLSVPGL